MGERDSDPDYFEFDREDCDEDEDEFYDCGMGPDGQCMKAGSEECDWECPIMADIIRAEIRSKKEKAK